jgi:hypothetical protein
MGSRGRGGVILTSTPDLIEVTAGRWRAPDACTELDLEAAQQLAAEVMSSREDIEAMLLAAARYALDVPDDLRERLNLGVRGLPATRSLRDELAAIVRPAG